MRALWLPLGVALSVGLGALGAKAASPAAPMKLVAVGDISCGSKEKDFHHGKGTDQACHMANTAALTRALNPLAVLVLGDNQYPAGSLHDYQESFDYYWGGDLLPRMHPVPGNHEYQTQGAAGYFDYFGEAAGPRWAGYYAFDLGSWHLIALNSNCDQVNCGPGSEQLAWLEQDLAAHPEGCTLAFFHHPRFSTSIHGDTAMVAPLWGALSRARIDLVLVGHDHEYQRFEPMDEQGKRVAEGKGIREIVIGTGGKSVYKGNRPRPAQVVAWDKGFGVLELMLQPHGYGWRFVPEKDGEFQDSGTASCRVRGGKSAKH